MSTAPLFCDRGECFRIPPGVPVENFYASLSYKPQPGDIFIVGYPKTGTTWLQHILMPLTQKGRPIATIEEFAVITPYLEIASARIAKQNPRPAAIKSHLPLSLMPWSSKAKYIYIARNPKDTCVSFYHHARYFPLFDFEGSFDEFFENFIDGEVRYGDYFDHVMGWYERRDEPNVLFLTYEELKEDTKGTILKIANFINDETTKTTTDPMSLESILQVSSFDHMRKVFNKSLGDFFFKSSKDEYSLIDEKTSIRGDPETTDKTVDFVRKGLIGDWRNFFSDEQSRRMDERFLEKTRGTGVFDLWSRYK